jgi:hypothetical protein
MTAKLNRTSCILRIAGVPSEPWLAAANPALFAMARALAQSHDAYRERGRWLAEELGAGLLSPVGLPRLDRNLAVELRRSLHNGRPLEPARCDRLVEIAGSLGHDAALWRERLAGTVEAWRALTGLDQALERAVAGEEARQAELAWTLVCTVPIVRVLVSHRDPSFVGELEQRAARGIAWHSKSARRSGAYVWKVLTRAATKSNPRDWHGHVALLPVCSGVSGEALGAGSGYAAQWVENAHRQRRVLMQGESTREDVRVALTPFHWRTETHLRAWVVDREDPTAVQEVEMRRISLLDAVYDALAGGSVAWDELAAARDVTDPEERALRPGFAEHLVRLGVLELSSSPRERLVAPDSSQAGCAAVDALVMGEARASAPEGSTLDARRKEAGFLDVYRRSTGSLPSPLCARLQRQFGAVQRLYALIEADGGLRASEARTSDRPPVPLLEAIEARVLTPLRSGTAAAASLSHHWPPASDAGSGYGRLLAWIAGEADRAETVDIDAARLDALGAPGPSYDWPVDCVLRLPNAAAAYDAVLDEAYPAGTLDARFVGALRRIEGAVPHCDGYREFLEELEACTGATILELLIPPLSMGAANAIRRPLLAQAWTGDPDVQMYVDGAHTAALRYVPLGTLTLRRAGGVSVVEAGGRRMWPVYHATRLPLPPWNVLADVLLTAAPSTTRWIPRRLHFSLDAFPERSFMPRITVGGGLVVSCAQWRLGAAADGPWDRRASLRDKIVAVERLRARLGLPRWVFASSGWKRKPVACDLESTLGLRAVEHAADEAARTGRDVILAEMLPTPNELLVVDQACGSAGKSVSSVVLRLPYDEPPRAMARRIAGQLRGR